MTRHTHASRCAHAPWSGPGLALLLALSGCGSSPSDPDGGDALDDGSASDAGEVAADAEIVAVWLAQTHVHRSDDPLLRLTGDRAALVKVDVVSASGGAAPSVVVDVSSSAGTMTLTLNGPGSLPRDLPIEKGQVTHDHATSFTATIPREHVRPGLQLAARVGEDTRDVAVPVGAPSVVRMTMFDALYFGEGEGRDYPEGWRDELEAKWPVSELRLQRLPAIRFTTLVVPLRADLPAARVSSREEYMTQTGQPFDGEQATALRWVAALSDAGGQRNLALYYVNIYGVNSGGQAGGFRGVGNGTAVGILHHELGHALSLPHWGDNPDYPYKGDMFGIQAPENYMETHAGPTWAFDLPTGTFIPPTVQPGNPRDLPVGRYKQDPMQGGGFGDQEPEFLLRHFSDYSVAQMQRYLENHVAVWRADLGEYARWDDEAAEYGDVRSSNGVNYPLENDVQVLTVMAATSMADTDVNLVYPPIGPYESGIIQTFDPRDAGDREAAAMRYCPRGGCDFSLRITQGGNTGVYMLRATGDELNPLVNGSLGTAAINLRASEGDVTEVVLLATPNAEVDGLPSTERVLDRWTPGG